MSKKTYTERYNETNRMSTDEISKLISDRKGGGHETGVAERIYQEREGRSWQADKDLEKALDGKF